MRRRRWWHGIKVEPPPREENHLELLDLLLEALASPDKTSTAILQEVTGFNAAAGDQMAVHMNLDGVDGISEPSHMVVTFDPLRGRTIITIEAGSHRDV